MFSDCRVFTETDRVEEKKNSFFSQIVWVNTLKDMPLGSPLHFESHKMHHADFTGYLWKAHGILCYDWLTIEVSGQVKFWAANEWKFRLERICHERDVKSTCEQACLSVLVLTEAGNMSSFFWSCSLLKSNIIFISLQNVQICFRTKPSILQSPQIWHYSLLFFRGSYSS